MDAHLFRRFCKDLLPCIMGARMEKIYAPDSTVLIFTLYGGHLRKKQHLVFSYGKITPFLFLSDYKIPVNAEPPAQIMRFRKYCSEKRITRAFSSWTERILYLEFAESVILALDLRNGASLLFQNPSLPAEPLWPESTDELSSVNTKLYTVLTPALRRTLLFLDKYDALALCMDLQEGGGDVFLYEDTKGRKFLSAWSIPEKQREEKKLLPKEDIFDNALLPASLFGDQILTAIGEKSRTLAAKPFSAEIHRLEKLQKKLDEEEKRLIAMQNKKKNALALQSCLYLFSPEKKYPAVTVESELGSIIIPLDPRYTVRENMQEMFHQAERGARGLQFLAKRRKEVEQEKERAEAAQIRVLASVNGYSPQEIRRNPKKTKENLLPKQIQTFRSSDGFILLRGRDSRGNLLALKWASPHDYWLHTADGSSAHVIIRRNHAGQIVPKQTLIEAGILAALKSRQKDQGKALIQYAMVKYLHPMKNAALGMVKIDKLEGTFTVSFDDQSEDSLQKV